MLHDQIKEKIKELNLDVSHMTHQGWNTGGAYRKVKIAQPISEILVENSKFTSSNKLRIKLLRDGLKEHKCESCGNTEWMFLPIPLELHHVNSIRTDNRIENIQLLCPNCHALTPNYRGRNIGKNTQ